MSQLHSLGMQPVRLRQPCLVVYLRGDAVHQVGLVGQQLGAGLLVDVGLQLQALGGVPVTLALQAGPAPA